VEVAWARACWGGLEVGGDEEGVALALSLVEGEAVVTLAAATAAAREDLGGEANGAGGDVAGGVGAAPWTGLLMGVDWLVEVAFGGMAPGDCFFELQLLWGGEVLRWAGVPAGLSTSIGEALVVRIMDAAMAYEWGAVVIGVVAASWEAGEGSMSIGVEDVSLVHLEAGGLTVVGGGPRKGKKLPPFLEGLALFWPQAMVEKRVLPERLWVWCESQERVLVVYWW